MNARVILSAVLAAALLALTGCTDAGGGQSSSAPAASQASSSEASSQADRSSALSDEQLRALAFGAVLSTRNPMDFDTLFGAEDAYKEPFREVLEDSWDTRDRDSAIATLDWLRDEGHRISADSQYYGYDEVYRIVVGQADADPAELEMFRAEAAACEAITQALTTDYGYTQEELAAVTTVSAWDYDRLVTVARWCYGVGYITEEEAWAYINEAAKNGAADYDGWRTYFAGVLYGRAIWSEDDSFSDKKIADKLLKDSDSIYEAVSFAG